MSQSDSSSQSIPKTVHPTAEIIKSHMEMWNAFKLTHPFYKEGEGFIYVLNLTDTPYSIGKQNLAGWNSWDDICKIESLVHRSLVCNYRGREIIEVKVP